MSIAYLPTQTVPQHRLFCTESEESIGPVPQPSKEKDGDDWYETGTILTSPPGVDV